MGYPAAWTGGSSTNATENNDSKFGSKKDNSSGKYFAFPIMPSLGLSSEEIIKDRISFQLNTWANNQISKIQQLKKIESLNRQKKLF